MAKYFAMPLQWLCKKKLQHRDGGTCPTTAAGSVSSASLTLRSLVKPAQVIIFA